MFVIDINVISTVHSVLLYFPLKTSGGRFLKEQGDIMQNLKPLWKKLLKERDIIYFIINSDEEEDDVNKMTLMIQEHFI